MTSVRIGKARIEIDPKGCIDCGTEWSSAWHHAKSLVVTVDRRTIGIDLYRCAECHARQEKGRQMEIQVKEGTVA